MHENPPNEALSGAFLRLVRGLRLLERTAKCCEGVTLAQCTLLETRALGKGTRVSPCDLFERGS